jgi:hypothetical protein
MGQTVQLFVNQWDQFVQSFLIATAPGVQKLS